SLRLKPLHTPNPQVGGRFGVEKGGGRRGFPNYDKESTGEEDDGCLLRGFHLRCMMENGKVL
ncbi:hypothetical protein Gogos_009078, partial [Gossypium gossypioides]|nr:hypothetical protein [Gossypium gossypioides]